jgi:hypothetical protein
MKNKEIKEIINSAILQIRSEARPLQIGASERSFAHRLAVYMEKPFKDKDWDVDCEYNRHGTLSKELEGIASCNEQKSTDRIFPDIIVHRRSNNSDQSVGENLLVIEIKNSNGEDACDRRKLELLTDKGGNYKYQIGLYINIGQLEFNTTWYEDGEKIPQDLHWV